MVKKGSGKARISKSQKIRTDERVINGRKARIAKFYHGSRVIFGMYYTDDNSAVLDESGNIMPWAV